MPRRPRPYKPTPYRSPYKKAAFARKPIMSSRSANVRTGGFIDIENKFLDTERTSYQFAASWNAINPSSGCTGAISVPAQGDGESARDGRVYYIKSVHVKGMLRIAAYESQTGPVTPVRARIILYWDTQTNGAEATATNIMVGGKDEDVLSFRNLQNSKRFIVLKDKTYVLRGQQMNEGASNLFAVGAVMVPFKFNKSFKKPIKVRCTGTTANVSAVSDNSIGIAAVRDDDAYLSPSIEYQARVRFQG